jgi:hypothetical protein
MRQFVATPTVEELEAEIERLTKGWEGLEYETSAQIASLAAAVNTMHKEAIEQEAEIERLKGDIQILKLQRDATHFSRCPRCNPKPRGEWCSSTDPTALEGDDERLRTTR